MFADESCLGDYGDVSSYFYYNWSSANTAVATVNATGTHTGVSVGSTTSSTWANLIYSEYKPCVRKLWQPGAGDNVVGPPDHLVVVVDQQGASTNCSSTGVQLRQMKMRVVDANGNAIPGGPSIAESFNPAQPSNSCGNGSPIPAACAPTASDATFIDSMAVSKNLCNSGINRSSGCGYSQTSTWSLCGGLGTNNLWVSPRTTLSNLVTVDGNSTKFAAGTNCNTSGCH